MSPSIIILGFSLLLLLYWFRYTCLLILSAKGAKDYTARVSQTNGLELVRVQAALKQQPQGAELAELRAALLHDYQLLTGILRHTARFQIAGFNLEQRMLMVDFRAMTLWYFLIRQAPGAEAYARAAVEEMADVVAHFANTMGEHSMVRGAGLAGSRPRG